MRIKLSIVVLVMMLAGVLPAGAERQLVEAILARVNDRVVTISEFRQRLQQELAQRPQEMSRPELEQFAEAYLDDMIDELVLLERAGEKRVTIADAQLDEAIKGLREENNLNDDEAFRQALASVGLTEEGLRERYRTTMTVQRTVQAEVKPTEITEEEVRALYQSTREDFRVPEKIELEQVFLPVAEDDSDRREVQARGRGMVERVRGGADLRAEATLAGVELQPLGAIPVEDLRDELRQALDGVPPGGCTEPLEVPGGYQILHVKQRLAEGYRPYDEVEELVRRRLSQERFNDQTQGLVDRLKRDYLVEVRRDLLSLALLGLASG